MSGKPQKLSSKKYNKSAPQRLASRTDVPFVLSFEHKLRQGYTFKELSLSDVAVFQRFLDKVSQMSFNDVDKLYRRPTDDKDTLNSKQIIHYEASYTFRIHGFIENGRFVVLRLDPNHKIHG